MNARQSLSRRRFLSSSAVATSGALLLHATQGWTAFDTVDSRVDALVSRTIGIDTHNHLDVPLDSTAKGDPNLDLAREMKRSGLSAACITFATDYGPGDAYQRFINGFAAIDRYLERNHTKRALASKEIRSAHASKEPAVIQAIEGGHFLEGRIERVEEAYKKGLRHFGLLHDSDASVPLGDVYTSTPRFGGLTSFGRQVIGECNRLGMLIDLAHADLNTTRAALSASAKPIIISHTGLDTQHGSDAKMAEMMRPRLISKEHASLVAKAGGVVGVWTHLSDSPLDYARNVRALVDVIGVDHVCIGTDTKLTSPYNSQGDPGGQPRPGERTNEAWPNQRFGFYYSVVDAMLKTGFTPQDIEKIGGGNYLRLFTAACSI